MSKLLENKRNNAKANEELLTQKRLRIAELETKFKEEKYKKTNLKNKLVQERLRVEEFQLLLENEAKQKESVQTKSKELEKLAEEEKELRIFMGDKYARKKYRAEDLLVDNKDLSDRNKALEKIVEE